jgi:hypothetical protein
MQRISGWCRFVGVGGVPALFEVAVVDRSWDNVILQGNSTLDKRKPERTSIAPVTAP